MATFNISGSWSFETIEVPSMGTAVTSEVVYYDSLSGVLSYGAAPSGSGWSTSGDIGLVGGILGTLDNQDWTMRRNTDVLASFASGSSTFDVAGIAYLYVSNCTEVNIGNGSSCNVYLRGLDMQLEGQTLRLDTGFAGSSVSVANINATNLTLGNQFNCDVSVNAKTLNMIGTVAIQMQLPIVPGVNNTPLLIDTDGTIHI